MAWSPTTRSTLTWLPCTPDLTCLTRPAGSPGASASGFGRPLAALSELDEVRDSGRILQRVGVEHLACIGVLHEPLQRHLQLLSRAGPGNGTDDDDLVGDVTRGRVFCDVRTDPLAQRLVQGHCLGEDDEQRHP